jgi:hypothetical protein
MNQETDPYYSRPEVSNSMLTSLKHQLYGRPAIDTTEAFRFGKLVDALLTEPAKIDFNRRRIDGEHYDASDFERAGKLVDAFKNHPTGASLLKYAEMQRVTIREQQPLEYNGFKFELPMRCKWDFFAAETLGITADLKTTPCKTEAEFRETIEFFDYDRQAALYMDLEKIDRFLLIGVSKTNHRVFIVPVGRGSALYESGREKYSELAFHYYTMIHLLK